MFAKATTLIMGLALAGCVTTRLSQGGEQVRVTSNPDVVVGCQYLGPTEGRDRMNGGYMGQGAAEENSMRRIRNSAAKMGANTVHLVSTMTGMSGSTIRGEAYHCEGTG